jgi:hypothetical protein
VLAATTIMVVATASGVFAIRNRAIGGAVVLLGLIGAAYVSFRVPTRERVVAQRGGAGAGEAPVEDRAGRRLRRRSGRGAPQGSGVSDPEP